MSNRILKQDICTSEEVDQLSWFEEVLFYRLIVNADDYGCFDRRAKIIKSALFPLKEVTTKQIDSAVDRLSTVGLVRVYEVQGRPYLQLTTWSKHQRLRTSKHRFPTPEEADLPQSAASGGDLPQSAASGGLARASLRIQSESESESEFESESEYYCSEQSGDCTEPPPAAASPNEADVPAVILNDGTEWRPSVEDVEEWQKLYPGIDIAVEFGRMRQWCKDNPKKRKTRNGVRRFARGWLDREQNRGWKQGDGKPRENKFNNFQQNHYDFDALEKRLLNDE